MKLAELQALFFRRVTEPSREGAGSGPLDALVLASDGASADVRLDIYADMYLWRLLDALRESFPKVLALLGDDIFAELGTAYVRAHPSQDYDIGHFGRLSPEFLSTHPIVARRAGVAELAALEWARDCVFHDAHRPSMDRQTFQKLSAEHAASLRFELVPSVRLLRVQHDVVGLFRQLDQGGRVEPALVKPTNIVVWRPEYEVFHARVDPCEANALALARQGVTLAEICAAFAGEHDPVQTAYRALASWLDEGFIVAPPSA